MEAAEKRFSVNAIAQLRQAIAEAGGNEVFFIGRPAGAAPGLRGIIDSVDPVARGNDFSTPAVLAEAEPGCALIHNHPGGDLTPSTPDINIAAGGSDLGLGFYIINNEADKVYVVVEIPRKKEIKAIDAEQLAGMFRPDSELAKKLLGYEHRPLQEEMTRSVADGFNFDRISMIEAGTGTGKTLAYLLPAVTWATENRERVVISTRTINLQEQLIHKDIPFLKANFGRKFEAALVKGAGNYLCLRRLTELKTDPDMLAEDDDDNAIAAISDWSKNTEDGSISDLGAPPSPHIWEKVCAETDFCMRLRCRHYDKCFYQNSRRRAASANIMIANHALLMSDLAVRQATENYSGPAVLPPYQRVIIDEAHNLEISAASYFATTASRRGAKAAFGRLFHIRRGKGRAERGLLPLARKLLFRERSLFGADVGDRMLGRIGSVLAPRLIMCAEKTDELFLRLDKFVAATVKWGEKTLRITNAVSYEPAWENEIAPSIIELKTEIESYATALYDFKQLIAKNLTRPHERFESLCWQLDAAAGRIETLGRTFGEMLNRGPDQVRWIETFTGKSGVQVRITSAPVDPAPILRDALYNPFGSVVLTSATLAVEGSFDFFARGSGVELVAPERIDSLQLASPFDYANKVLLGAAGDLPSPSGGGWDQSLAKQIGEILQITGGRAFVLTTNSALVRKLYDRLAPALQKAGINAMHQFSGSRHQLVEKFKMTSPSVLFATDSFWEGVDVVGSALECIIITRLPFAAPNEPLLEAKLEYIESKGLNKFRDYQLPSAVIKLKQGFGRLIRHHNDRGAVIILDPRLLTKGYGKKFLRSLPDCRRSLTDYQQMIIDLREFF